MRKSRKIKLLRLQKLQAQHDRKIERMCNERARNLNAMSERVKEYKRKLYQKQLEARKTYQKPDVQEDDFRCFDGSATKPRSVLNNY